MAHCYGANCRRERKSRQRGSGTSCASPGGLPATITADGKTRYLTRHLRHKGEEGVAESDIIYVLENWTIKGVCANRKGNVTGNYWGFLPNYDKIMMRVVVSQDNEEIITAYYDGTAAENYLEANIAWFRERCRELEVRDAG